MHLELPSVTHKSSKVLVVDDDSDIRSLTRTFLEHEGYVVYSSGDAVRAAQIFSRSQDIDLLITDYSMPKRSGLDLAHELGSLRPSLRVLIISGVILSGRELAQIQENRWRFLPKPFSLPQLLSEVHSILSSAPCDDRSATLIA